MARLSQVALRKNMEQLKAEYDYILGQVESSGLVEVPGARLKIETIQDRIWVAEWLWHCKRKKMSLEEYARQFPVEWKRLQEILPRKEEEE